MTSAFALEFQDTSDDLDEEFGERFTIVAQITDDSGEYFERGENTQIPQRQLWGIPNFDPVVSTTLGSGANTHENVDVATNRDTIDFDIRLFSDPVTEPMPHAGWILRRDDEPGLPLYQVVTAQPDGVSRLVCKVVFKGLSQT